MDQYKLRPDECDNKLIRFNNCIQIFSCICNILGAFNRNFHELAQIIDLIADIVFFSTVGCMVGQIYHELDYQKAGPIMTAEAQVMDNPIQAGEEAGAPSNAEEMER